MSSSTLTVHVRAKLSKMARGRLCAHILRRGHWSYTLNTVKGSGRIVGTCNACNARIAVGDITIDGKKRAR